MPSSLSSGRPRGELPDTDHTLTERVRRLIDVAHNGNVRDASRLTGIPYPTLNDLYIGRTVSPNLLTLEKLRVPYGIEITWLLSEAEPSDLPRKGIVAYLPPDPSSSAARRALRIIEIPFTAWPMYEVFTELAERLGAIEPWADRPIVGEASGDALLFRLSTFLFQPLLAAEKNGETDLFRKTPGFRDSEPERCEICVKTLSALGEMWRAALPGFLRGQTSTGPAAESTSYGVSRP